MDALHLINTPRRTALAAHSTTLRTKLKDWEKAFAASHSGQRPGKEDIKACLDVARTYQEYHRVRDVLAGRLGVESIDGATRQSPTTPKHGRKQHRAGGRGCDTEATREAANTWTPSKAKASLHQGQSAPHPNLLDPYDPPAWASPRPYVVTAIGPTPQRDGQVLGLFDLLSNSGNSSQATPSARKRKIDTLGHGAYDDAGIGPERVVTQTPSIKRMRKGTSGVNVPNHLTDTTPKANQRHSRTPASEGKKFMLSHYFATPSTMRFAAIGEDHDAFHRNLGTEQSPSTKQTPLRRHVLGDRAMGASATEMSTVDATPAYLKRSYSFKDRLLSVSTSAIGTTNSQLTNLSSPSSVRVGPPTLRRYKSGPKPLSEIVRGLRQMDDEWHDDDDDLEALREMEGGQINVLLADSQATELGAGAEEGSIAPQVEVGEGKKTPLKVWKKKGQKRTTRRAIMRPAKMQPRKENQWVAEDSASETGDEPEAVSETQYPSERAIVAVVDNEEETPGTALAATRGSEGGSDAEFEVYSDRDELDDYEKPAEPDSGAKKIATGDNEAEATKPKRKRGSIKDKFTADKPRQKKGPTINPNAVSHQNFRTLKIRNKNSKAKGGRGRLGRKGR